MLGGERGHILQRGDDGLRRDGGPAAEPTGRLTADMDPQRNFGAALLI